MDLKESNKRIAAMTSACRQADAAAQVCADAGADIAAIPPALPVVALKAAEQVWSRAANDLTGADWRRQVDTIDDKAIRMQVACVVWWDYFGGRPASDPWRELDAYKAVWVPEKYLNPAKVSKSLNNIGYPARRAESRINACADNQEGQQ